VLKRLHGDETGQIGYRNAVLIGTSRDRVHILVPQNAQLDNIQNFWNHRTVGNMYNI
jgi:hypothetical protein